LPARTRKLVDHIEHKPGQMIGRQPVAEVGWEQERLVTVTGKEVVGHGRSYAISLLCCRFRWPLSSRFRTRLVRVNCGMRRLTGDHRYRPAVNASSSGSRSDSMNTRSRS
jgi:hypothetical protein